MANSSKPPEKEQARQRTMPESKSSLGLIRLTYRQLEYFLAAAESGSIVAASERVHISPPSISVAIAQLEEELEVQLFVRLSSGLQLTSAGEEVLLRARTILETTRGLNDVSNARSGELRGKISLGCLTTLAPLVLPEVCQSFAHLHPSVSIDLIDGTQDYLIGLLRRGVADLVITYDMHIPKDLRFEALVGLPPLIMLGADHRLAQQPAISLQDIESDPYILLDLPFSRDYFLSIFEKVGAVPNVRIRTTNFEVLRTLVASNFGYSIAVARPRNEAALDGKPIVSKPITNPLPCLDIGVLTRHTDFTRVAKALKNHIKSLIGQSSVPGMRPLP